MTGYGLAGEALHKKIVDDLAAHDRALDPREEEYLDQACRLADTVEALDAAVAAEGVTVVGSQGQPRLHPGIAEARLARLAMARLLGNIELPSDEPAPTAKQAQARAAARARWQRRAG